MIEEAEIWLIGIAMVATVSSIGFGIWSNLNTRKSNELHSLELREKFKPFVDVIPPHQIEQIKHEYVFNPKIENKGVIPIYDLVVNYVVLHKRYTIEEIVLNEDHIKEQHVSDEGSLFPNLIFQKVHIPLTEDDVKQSTLIIVLWMEFEYWENLREEQIYSVHFSNGESTGFGNLTSRDINKIKDKISQVHH